MAPGPHCIRTAHDLAARRPADRRRLRDVRDQRRADALVRGLPRGVSRGIPLEPRRDVPGLLGLGVRQRGKCPVRRSPGGSPRPSAARPARGRGAGARAPRKRVRTRALAAHRALRRPHDGGRQLPRARGVRADALAPLREQSRHGDLDRPVGQRLRARRVGAGRPAPDLDDRLAARVCRAGGADGGARLAARRTVSARREAGAGRVAGPIFGARRRDRGSSGATRLDARRGDGYPAFLAPVHGLPLTGLGSFFVSLHQLAFAVDAGFDKLYAASVLGLGALLSVAGVIVTGTLSDYIGRELSAVLAYAVSIIGVICALFITGPDHAWLLWIHACFFGLTWGARGPSVTAKTADLFPGPNLGAILGVITVGTGIGSAVGAWGAGWIFDMSGSYRLAFVASIVSYLIGCAAFWALRRPPTRQVV